MREPSPRTVLFICRHGALRSRLAALFFNHATVVGWRATSAGLEPQTAISEFALPLAASQGLAHLLDRDPPRPLSSVPTPDLVVTVDCDLPAAAAWHLDCRDVDEALAVELRTRAERLAKDLANEQT